MAKVAAKTRHNHDIASGTTVFVEADPARLDAFFALDAQLGTSRAGPGVARQFFRSLFGGIDFAGKRVLDIGGGDGRYSFYAALMGAREVVCLEPEAMGSVSSAARQFARFRAAEPELPVLLDSRTIQEYRDDQPGERQGFDIILMIASINHVDEDACIHLLDDPGARARYRGVFAHIATLARPGARLFIMDCARRNFFPTLGLVNPLCPTIEWHKHQDPRAWATLLEESGFTHPRISWEPLYRFGRLAERLLANRAAAFFLKGCFRLEVDRAALGAASDSAPV